MLTKPKYKVCKRLGSGVYEKCQTQKFAMSEARAKKTFGKGRRRNISDYGRQLLEKQKVRFAYGITEKQLRRYVNESTKTKDPSAALFTQLETRLDNVVYRLGLAATRRAARQLVSHGHITVNGQKMNVPSHTLSANDTISVREGSRDKKMFTETNEKEASHTPPSWLTFDRKKMAAKVVGGPEFSARDGIFDFSAVFEFYSR